MINKIISYSIRNKFIITLVLFALIGGGIYSIMTINLDSTPDITNNQVQVITVSPNLSTEDIEQFVTYPVELSMSNLPGVTEIRSVSRFGLSVVTIVFKDGMGTYLPRQVVQEKLNDVKEQIPQQFGTPKMGPITTGLGEIFQYTIRPKKSNNKHYTPMELRSIQDWLVKRRMALIPGVIEVNSFGGNIKQYEIALNPDRLKSMNVSISEVFDALQHNNVNTGGAYIEKNHQANFIRGEGLVKNIDDIKKIVVKNDNGIPILIQDVAENVSYGSQVRYGAFTQDGEEAVGGMILMLKGENSNDVIKRVKQRIAELQQSLPSGLEIVPFLDRSNLIQRTTSTIARNLLEGALIVVFVLVLLLGSLRGGLITASVIPLSLLFAFILMKIFDVWANLMSLGAIDFGIIVDGAVIIIESTVHTIEQRCRTCHTDFSSRQMNTISYEASRTMMHSAFFGQLIILIVFTPIMFLSGVEGKMFQPMAYTFSFAVLGAILLCLTYVPVISSVVMKPMTNNRNLLARIEGILAHFSQWLMEHIYSIYHPILKMSLRHHTVVVLSALILFAGTIFVFTHMGGVFIPSLDEGDIAMQTFLRPGSSLSETIKREKEVERTIKKNFPEVKTVCARIGVADIPTDPMGFDYTDCFIILEKDRSKWVSAQTKEELIEKIKQKLSELPGLNFSFSQPVELRFNELLTGVREDIAVKLYGDDLDVLNQKGQEMTNIINHIQGASDVNMERTSGLPQMTVKYDRSKIAQYGLDISKLNQYISSAFAGTSAGIIFEGEKRYDMVIRFDSLHRKGIDDLQNLYVDLPNGNQIPIKEVANIHYEPSPMQISRDNTSRRIYIGVNARGRDIESLVFEIKQKLSNQLILPAGYHITYGGAFENLQRAKNRLSIVLPIALLMIFILLYFALHSFKQTVMIYMAVPLAAIGGVLALFVRGMPFSISAGVGFIVLFGVAVLNGLVLINRFNSLAKEGVKELSERIYIGTKERLRPILLTASAAMLGFLPMAISQSAGAEVQRPLATVVIGGLFSSTFLTLILVPILYDLEEKWKEQRMKRKLRFVTLILMVCMLSISISSMGQKELPQISLEEAIRKAETNNHLLEAARLNIKNQETLKKTVFEPGATQLYTGGEELGNNNDGIYTLLSVRQELDFLSTGARSKAQRHHEEMSKTALHLTTCEIKKEISLAYVQVFTARHLYELSLRTDSLLKEFERAAKIRFDEKATSKMEYLAALTQTKQSTVLVENMKRDYSIAIQNFNVWFVSDTLFTVDDDLNLDVNRIADYESNVSLNHPLLQLSQQQVSLADDEIKLKKIAFLPKFYVEYGSQKIGNRTGYHSYQIGMSIPLFFGASSARIKSARIEKEIARENYLQKQQEINTAYHTMQEEYAKWYSSCRYYQNAALPTAREQREMAMKIYQEGGMDYLAFIQNLKDAVQVETDYWKAFGNCLQAQFKLEYFKQSSK